MKNSELLPKPAQPSGGGFIAVDKILKDLTDRNGLRQAWESIDRDTQADIKHQWALFVTQVLDMQALVIKSRTPAPERVTVKEVARIIANVQGDENDYKPSINIAQALKAKFPHLFKE